MFTPPLRASARGARRRVVVPFLIAAPLAVAALPSVAQAGSVTFDEIGCGGLGGTIANEWTVPAGVTELTVTGQGARGGGPQGGQGTWLTGRLTVTPGTALYACVDVGGGAGGSGPAGSGESGGGYSSLSSAFDGSAPFFVASGGGGTGGAIGGSTPGIGGTAGNGIAGTAGGTARWVNTSNMPSNGGGGAAHSPAASGVGGVNAASSAANGLPGFLLAGGDGGTGQTGGVGGGGGGGGVYGGGGGAGSMAVMGGEAAGGGGGGGTSSCALTDCGYATTGGGASVQISWVDPPATTTTAASLDVARPRSQQWVAYTATVAPVPSGGTVAFRVGAATVSGCEARPVDTVTGVATCDAIVPGDGGDYELTTTYGGTTGFSGSEGRTTFHVYAGHVTATPSPTADFGAVELGRSTTRDITVRNEGDADVEIDAVAGIRLTEYLPDLAPSNPTDYAALADACTGSTLAPGESCVVTVQFTPTALGERLAQIRVASDAWSGSGRVKLVGTGIEPSPEPRPEPRPQERQPEPQPQTPPAGTPAPTQPSAPSAPEAPAVGASANLGAGRGAQVSRSGRVRLPLVCPAGQPCTVAGTLTLAASGGQARASQTAKVRVLARFSGISIAAGRTRTLSLRLPASFVKAQQKRGVRRLRTTLTVRTTLGDGTRVTRRQTVTIVIPRARAAQRRAAPAPAPAPARRPSFTG